MFTVNRTSGEVRVAQPIDYEQTGNSLTFEVSATGEFNVAPTGHQPKYQTGPPTKISVTVHVIDLNDNEPKIDYVKIGSNEYNETYFYPAKPKYQPKQAIHVITLKVSEITPIKTIIVDTIIASDGDKFSSSPLTANCEDCEPEFKLNIENNSNATHMVASIELAMPLVYVPNNEVRQFQVVVSDGEFKTSILFEVHIEDVQNKPPVFIGSSTCIVHENSPIDKVVAVIQAVDGDAFSIDELPNLSALSKGSFNGRQIVYDMYDPTTKQYSSSMNGFKLDLITGQLQVANRLDREMHLASNGVLTLTVRARELKAGGNYSQVESDDFLAKLVDESNLASNTTDISVILLDVNDNGPHWLNASEIISTGVNISPDWYKSLTSYSLDNHMIFHVQIRENSLPGTPITAKNEIFVYDLDNGQNANFNLSIEDKFNIFDVEPKQISGFAMVTLKLSGAKVPSIRKRGQSLLDYEDPNERSFIIELVATETNTNERFTSKAQIRVKVLDVNDNAPEFKESVYIANIREDAAPGKSVLLVNATDRDEVSRNLSYSLHGKSSHLFDINSQTGLVTVAKCEHFPTVSQVSNRPRQIPMNPHLSETRSCIDYETQRTHHLMVEVSDGQLSKRVPLTIFIDDVSDNPPIFTIPVVDVVLEEGAESFSPPLKLEATDLDRTSMLTYSIVEGNYDDLFMVNNATGELQLTRPIRLANQEDGLTNPDIVGDHRRQQLNMVVVVQASDGIYTSNCTVRIDVLDANDNAPKFIRPFYQAEIDEPGLPGNFVIAVTAIDSDRGNNAKVSYRIERGSFNQFEIDESNGSISVSRYAKKFDSSKRETYTLEIVAYDHGLNSKSSSVLVYIKVLDTIKAAPKFEPQTQRVSVEEKTLNNTIIHRMSVANSDDLTNQKLTFMPGRIEALDKNGRYVSSGKKEYLESMLSVSTDTGDVMVNSELDHDIAAFINFTIYLYRRNDLHSNNTPKEHANPSVGYLAINVIDENNNAPIFAAPWSPMQTELSFQMLEELPVGSVLTQLIATDAESKISHYKIEPANEYFELMSRQSGVIVNKKQIDYDALMSQTFLRPGSHRSNPKATEGNNIIQFNVYAYDFGVPQLSAKATVSVEILPVNDCDCKFEQQIYQASIKENSPMDTFVTQVRANDADYGEQNNQVRYQLMGENSDLFNIDPRTGLITVSKRGSAFMDLERLNQSTITLTVLGKDGDQAYSIDDMLSTTRSNRIYHNTNNPVNDKLSRTCSTTVKIHIDDVNDNPPLFMQRQYEVTTYDTDSSDVPLLKLLVRDDDSSSNKVQESTSSTRHLSNTFKIISGDRDNSFNVSDSGLLYTTKSLANSKGETNVSYQLRIQVRQQSLSLASFTDECLVRVNFVKINRFGPEWRFESSNDIAIDENAKPGTLVTQLKCTDRDYDSAQDMKFSKSGPQEINGQSPMRYYIKENGSNVVENDYFKLDSVSGNLVTKIELDRDTKAFHNLYVVCVDNGKPQSLSSVAYIYIYVRDKDDNKPEFILPPSQNPRSGLIRWPNDQVQDTVYHQMARQQSSKDNRVSTSQRLSITFNVEEQQNRGLQVGELVAVDPDTESRYPINYCIIEGNEFSEFYIDRSKGILYTNQTLDREKQSSYELLVKAINDGSNCNDNILMNYDRNAMNLSESSKNHASSMNANKNTSNLDVISVRVNVLDINDNAPTFRRPIHRAGVHYRSLMNTLVTQVAANDPDSGLNGTSNYRISEILQYRTSANYGQSQTASSNSPSNTHQNNHHHSNNLGKPIKLIQFPFRIDNNGNLYTRQLLTQYHLMSMFLIQIEAVEQAEPWNKGVTTLEVYIYETSNQLKMRINLHPRLVDTHRSDIEQMLSNATNYTAIINRARSYHEATTGPIGANKPYELNSRETLNSNGPASVNTLYDVNTSENNPIYLSTNIHLIFVDNFSIVNPNLVMEKFDLTSAQLFIPQYLAAQLSSANGIIKQDTATTIDSLQQHQNQHQQPQLLQIHEISSFIDKIALASVQSSIDSYHSVNGQSLFAGLDWLENPSMIYAVMTIALIAIGFVIFLFGCCCKSRIKDHIIKTAMNKLVEQQNIQAKINERMFQATNGTLGTGNERIPVNEHDFINSQVGLMSSFDATKGCINNNNENMSILQRAIESGEFVDPNYNTLNGHYNFGAHYYDTSELENQKANGETRAPKQVDESNLSLSLADHHETTNGQPNGRNYSNESQLLKTSKLPNGDQHHNINNNQRQRQQIPK